jgi:hypothetical protein
VGILAGNANSHMYLQKFNSRWRIEQFYAVFDVVKTPFSPLFQVDKSLCTARMKGVPPIAFS